MVNGREFYCDGEWVDEADILRFAGGDLGTHEVHQPGFEYGHPLTRRINVKRFNNLSVLDAAQVREVIRQRHKLPAT